MAELSASAVIHADQKAEAKTPQKSEGTLKTEGGKEHAIYPFSDTESVSQGVSKFLAAANEQEFPETLLANHTFTSITPETVETEHEIMHLEQALQKIETAKETPKKEMPPAKLAELPKAKTSEPIYSSLFSLAHSFNKGLAEARQQLRNEKQQQTREEIAHPARSVALSQPEKATLQSPEAESLYDQEGQEDEGFGGQQQQQQQDENPKKKKGSFKVKASRGVSRNQASHSSSGARGSLEGMENIFIRFMALMARILGQAEAEAHDLYMRIKERTDNIDLLTLFISKINSEKGAVNWSDNEEMKKLVDAARALGVDIPEGKYKWSEEEKKLLKENIQMRKDSMEKITQLERTDMQRYLQEASQCHQARSNVLKLLKEVMDTIIHNMRP